MIYGKSFNGRCKIDVNDRVKGDDLRVQAKHTEMLALLERHVLETSTRNSNNQVKLQIGEISTTISLDCYGVKGK